MAYDLDLAQRLRDTLADEPHVREKTMFGGLAFLVAGHMSVSVGSGGGLLLRVDPGRSEALLSDPQASPFEMRGRELSGWLHIDVDASASDAELQRWVDQSLDYVRSLPPK